MNTRLDKRAAFEKAYSIFSLILVYFALLTPLLHPLVFRQW